MIDYQVKAVVLAAGKGTRMKSSKAKVMHEVFFAPMLHHVLNAIQALGLRETVVVTGHQASFVEDSLDGYSVICTRQKEQLGTADAVLTTEDLLKDFKGTVLLLCGDTPLISPESLQALLTAHADTKSSLTVMTTMMDDPTNYGRIITDDHGNITKIVEEKDASLAEKKINEVNAGIYCIDATFLFKGLSVIDANNSQCEFYLTDLVEVALAAGLVVKTYACVDPVEVSGVNSRVELAVAHSNFQRRRNLKLMISGVTIIGSDSVDISSEVDVNPGCEIGRNVTISGKSVIGCDCLIGSNTIIKNCRIGDQVRIGPLCYLENCTLDNSIIVQAGTMMFDKN